jgi:hypothetical protein
VEAEAAIELGVCVLSSSFTKLNTTRHLIFADCRTTTPPIVLPYASHHMFNHTVTVHTPCMRLKITCVHRCRSKSVYSWFMSLLLRRHAP